MARVTPRSANPSPKPTNKSLSDNVHPRPQLAREEWLELDGAWEFAYDDLDVGVQAGWMRDPAPFTRVIQVPYPPESTMSGIAETSSHPVMWYRRVVSLAPPAKRRWLLHFGAVDYSATVWVNGSMVCQHRGGHTPFSADITAALRDDGDQVIVVRAEDTADLEQPRGKQHWEGSPEEIWYERTSGIWQPVWLELVARLHIESLRWTPDVKNLRLRMDVRLNRSPPAGTRLRVRLRRGDDVVVDDGYDLVGRALHRELGMDIGAPSLARRRELLWSPEFPNLLEAELVLQPPDGDTDVASSYLGLRDIDVMDGAFRLNGWPYYLRLVLTQGYWPQSHLAAPGADALRAEVELIKELGFNGVRMHQKVEDPRFLYWCDRLGLLVWEEMPSAYRFSEVAAQMAVAEWIEVLRRDHSHPSVVTWVAFNESWGVEWLRERPEMRQLVQALRAMALAADGTRPVIGNDGWEQEGEQVIGIHDYVAQPSVLRVRYGAASRIDETLSEVQPNGHTILLTDRQRGSAAVVLSEFGGISLLPDDDRELFAYGAVADSRALLHHWEDLFAAVLDSDVLAGFCYTQFCDTRQEMNGMVTENREPKVDPQLVRPLIQRAPSRVPAESILKQVLHPTTPTLE